ncbi:aspartate kinase [Lysinibacillus sp. KU-BSD001]|uniref:aspartate kinase n=1 Tax=Lysinibacillus sp. KU-BSD001 TaxID=3141328 RepID=UPI0036E8A233
MSSIVMKFGGPAVATPEKMQAIARRAIEEQGKGLHVVIVISPMATIRRELQAYAAELSDNPVKREQDVLLAAEAQMTSALLSIAITEQGGKAVSLAGWQTGVATDSLHNNARIEAVKTQRIYKHFEQGEIVVIAGSQGVDSHENITTFGKGGSETTAVAVAAAINAERVDMYTTVDGIYTADPHIVPNAKKLKELSYDEMLELANLGAMIIHPRAVELAKKYNIPVVVRSSTVNVEGTLLKEEVEMEKNLVVRGIAYESDIIRLTVGYDSYEEASLADIFTVLANNGINVDIIVQAVIDKVKPTISFSIEKEQFAESLRVLESSKLSLGFSFADFEVGLAKVSIVGSGMVSHPGIAARMFTRLSREGIDVKMVSTSEIKVSVVVPQEDMIRAANALHEEFNLTI